MSVINDGNEIVKLSSLTLAKQADEMGVVEIIINSIDRDGMMDGYDLKLVKNIAKSVKIPVTACGGAGGSDDLKKVLHDGGVHAAAGGSMFVYNGKLKAVLITASSEEELTKVGIYNV